MREGPRNSILINFKELVKYRLYSDVERQRCQVIACFKMSCVEARVSRGTTEERLSNEKTRNKRNSRQKNISIASAELFNNVVRSRKTSKSWRKEIFSFVFITIKVNNQASAA